MVVLVYVRVIYVIDYSLISQLAVLSRELKLRILIFLHKHITLITLPILIPLHNKCNITLIIKRLRRSNNNRLLILNLPRNNRLTLKNRLDRKLTVLFIRTDQLNRSLILYIPIIAQIFA